MGSMEQMRLAWATDLHLNFVDDENMAAFLAEVQRADIDAIAICGDTGESDSIGPFLIRLAESIERPVHFVLGNHDFYHGSIADTRQSIRSLAASHHHLTYLSTSGPIELTATMAVVGHDGWGDARRGDFYGTNVIVGDVKYIEELKCWKTAPEELKDSQLHYSVDSNLPNWRLPPEDLDRESLRPVLNELGTEAAEHLARVLNEAFQEYQDVIAITHVPPFPELCRIREGLNRDDWLPFYCCDAVGRVMKEIMQNHPSQSLHVLCGHTHRGGSIRVLDNLTAECGDTEYTEPKIQGVLGL